MNQSIAQILKCELSATGSQIPILIKVPLQVAIDATEEGVKSDIKLSLIDKEGVVNVLLHNASSLFVSSRL